MYVILTKRNGRDRLGCLDARASLSTSCKANGAQGGTCFLCYGAQGYVPMTSVCDPHLGENC